MSLGPKQPGTGVLWPSDHKLLAVGIVGVTDVNDDRIAITFTGVTQDEPANGLGDGDTGPDAVLDDGRLLLRAERSGHGNGRVYRVSFAANDGQGGVCTGTVRVIVPFNMKGGGTAIDDGQIYDSTRLAQTP